MTQIPDTPEPPGQPETVAAFMAQSLLVERAKARMWGAVSLLVQIIVCLALVPLIVLAAKATFVIWGFAS